MSQRMLFRLRERYGDYARENSRFGSSRFGVHVSNTLTPHVIDPKDIELTTFI